MTLSELKIILSGSGIDDVLLSGFVDKSEQPLRFHPSLSSYFLEVGETLLRISTLAYSGRCLMARVPHVSGDLDLDDDMEWAITSARQMLLNDPDGANLITRVTFWDAHDTPLGIESSAVRIDLANEQVLF